jgi:hypothetical protein
VVWVLAWCLGASEPVLLVIAIHLGVFFVCAVLCHGELALDRPAATRLTGFYLAVATGGALGGLFDALVAPAVFDDIREYPIAIVCVCLLAPARRGAARLRGVDLALAALPGVLAVALLRAGPGLGLDGLARRTLTLGLPALAAYLLSQRPIPFALAIAGLLAASGLDTSLRGAPLLGERSFFGVHRVTLRAAGTDGATPLHELYHGTTLHGAQRVDPATGLPASPREPLVYYHRKGPVGQVFDALGSRLARVGVVGLGAGAMAAYAERGRSVDFFEIDSVVARIAEDRRLFSYLSAARERGAHARIALGDARPTLADTSARFDLLVLDAFGSDAIPVHLLTREAFALYERRLAAGGVLACNASSRSLDLEPVLSALAASAGFQGWIQRDTLVSPAETGRSGRHPSEWVVLARSRADLAALLDAPAGRRWQPLARASAPPWTDDHVDLLSALRWR